MHTDEAASGPARGLTLHLGQLHGGAQRRKVDRLEDLAVELRGLGRVEGQAQQQEGVGQALQGGAGKEEQQ